MKRVLLVGLPHVMFKSIQLCVGLMLKANCRLLSKRTNEQERRRLVGARYHPSALDPR